MADTQVSKSSLFYLFLEKMIFPNIEHDIRQMTEEVEATNWRLLEFIRARELAVAYRLE